MPTLTPARRRFLEAAVIPVTPDDVLRMAVATIKKFGVAYRTLGETHPETIRRWRVAIEAQASYRYRLTPAGRAAVTTTEE